MEEKNYDKLCSFLNTAWKEIFILCSNNNSQLIQQTFHQIDFDKSRLVYLYFVFLDELVPSSRDRR